MSLKRYLLLIPRRNKQLIVIFCDFSFIFISFLLAFKISGTKPVLITGESVLIFSWFCLICLVVFWKIGIYRSVVRYLDLSFTLLLSKAILLFSLISISSILTLFYFSSAYSIITISIINKGLLVGFMTFTLLVFGSRLTAYHYFSNLRSEKRVVIYGAGSAGIQLASALRLSQEMQPIAFIDNNSSLHDTFLMGLRVLQPKKLEKLVNRGKIDEVLIAMPSVSKSLLRNLLKEIEGLSVKVRILPGLAELAQGKVLVSELKEVDTSDLLGRFEVEANQDLINKNIQNKVVLITGAGGSIGSEITRQAAKNNAKKIVLLDSNEFALYSIKREIENYNTEIEIYSVLASINNKKRISEVCKSFKVNTIYHAAAYKHVPLVEENPFEAVKNNILGTKICAEVASDLNIETFVLISTDKAVRPTNIMGATKRFAELILQSMAANTSTRMIIVRFGNVIGSSGSAIPLFQQQIRDGGPVTVTHPEVVRYFMSIPEAAELVIQAGALGKGGDVFVLDMGEPVKIYELAKRLINLSGMEVKDKKNMEGDIEIIFTGLRPGEKLYEELLIGDNVSTTEHKKILRAEEDFLESGELDAYLELISEAEKKADVVALRDILQKVVSGFKPEEEIVDVVYLQKNK